MLTASLATGVSGCKKQTVNVHPDEEPPHVNEGPEPTVEETVNEGPVEEPDAADEVDPEPEEGPNVNTVPDDAG